MKIIKPNTRLNESTKTFRAKGKRPLKEAVADITTYREELQQYIDEKTGRHQYFVDESLGFSDKRLCIEIHWGDWKHDHRYIDWLVEQFFEDKGLEVSCKTDIFEEDGSDCYSAYHYYKLWGKMDEPIKLDLMKLDICPNCGEEKFNDRTGLCIDCGYDEKSWGDLDESKSRETNAGVWYSKMYPDDTVGIKQLSDFTIEDVMKDKSLIDNCDTQVRERVLNKLKDYSPIVSEAKIFGAKGKKKLKEEKEDYSVKFYQVFEAPKSPTEKGKMIGQRGTLEDARKFAEEKGLKGEQVLIKAVCDDGKTRYVDNDLKESKITSVEPVVKFKGKSSHTFTKDKKWEVDFDEAGNIVARTRSGKPQYFSGTINDKVNDFPSTDEDNIVLAAREQHKLKFGSLNEASYGGAYDIEDDQFFTRDDLNEFSDYVVDTLNAEDTGRQYQDGGAFIERGNVLELDLEWNDYQETIARRVDMRKIKSPSDLTKVYGPIFVEEAKRIFSQYMTESLNEDIEGEALPGPQEGPESGLAALLNTAIQDEYKTIQLYNDLALTARAENFLDIADEIDEINTDENTHVGKLQELLKTISPNANAIESGEHKGEVQLTI